MLDKVIDQLSEQHDDFIKLWNENIRKAGYENHSIATTDYATVFFTTIISALRKIINNRDVSDLAELSEFCSEDVELFTEKCEELRRDGGTIDLALCCIKATQRAVGTLVKRTVADYEQELEMLSRICELTDVMEIAVVAEYNRVSCERLVSDLERMNNLLSKEMGIYKDIFDSTSNIVIVTDHLGVIEKVNPKAILFFSGKKIIGESCNKLLELGGDTLDELMKDFPPNISHEISIEKNDVEHVFNFQIRPFDKVSMSSSFGTTLILNDITSIVDRRETLEMMVRERTHDLSESQQMLQSVFQSVGKGIFLLDGNDEIIQVNQQACEIFGVHPNILLYKSFFDLIGDDSYIEIVDARCNLKVHQSASVEVSARYVDGRIFPAVVTITYMELKGEVFWPVIVRDVTEQKALENRLKEEKAQSEEINVTLKNVLKTIEDDRSNTEKELSHKIKTTLIPAVDRIKREKSEQARLSYLDILKDQLISLTSGTSSELDGRLLKLSKTELKVCNFIRSGLESKEICEVMNLSFDTIQSHRKNIRKKLGLKGRENSLYHYLINQKFEI